MSTERDLKYPIVDTFGDGRKPLHELYETYFELIKEGWSMEQICTQEEKQANGDILQLPIYGFLSPEQNKRPESALWIIGGIHGEEPAPAEAFFNEIELFKSLPDKGIAVAAIFMANPSGYHRDWRYFNLRRSPNTLIYIGDKSIPANTGKSVGDSEHLVSHPIFKRIPRRFKPNNKYADKITRWIIDVSRKYKPLLVMDHHEDEFQKNLFHTDWDSFYSYAYGHTKVLKIICPELVKILEKGGYPMQKDGQTRFHEKIEHGFVKNSMDGSVDNLFIEDKYFDHGKIKNKYPAKAAFVLETIIHHENPQPISERAKIHRDIIKSYVDFWDVVKKVR
ncbi:MAG TPA: hypothetical protein VMR19_01700 [Candidatus Saccharimonadales bacterium]|jgi:hypothetical protein|nr:hypothetical protein [Candidatus Saccharimonadales bacterium]